MYITHEINTALHLYSKSTRHTTTLYARHARHTRSHAHWTRRHSHTSGSIGRHQTQVAPSYRNDSCTLAASPVPHLTLAAQFISSPLFISRTGRTPAYLSRTACRPNTAFTYTRAKRPVAANSAADRSGAPETPRKRESHTRAFGRRCRARAPPWTTSWWVCVYAL